jgi:prophage DNA circulation protein
MKVTQERYDELSKTMTKEELKNLEVEKVLTNKELQDVIAKLTKENEDSKKHIHTLNEENKGHREAKEQLAKQQSELSEQQKKDLEAQGNFEALLKAEQTKSSDYEKQIQELTPFKSKYESSQEVISNIHASKLSMLKDESMRETFKDASIEQLDKLIASQNVVTESQESNLGNSNLQGKLTGNGFKDSFFGS